MSVRVCESIILPIGSVQPVLDTLRLATTHSYPGDRKLSTSQIDSLPNAARLISPGNNGVVHNEACWETSPV